MTSKQPVKVLIVEDVETKFLDVLEIILENLDGVEYTRASNLNDAEEYLMDGEWHLLVLDLSMDIAASGSMDLGSGHATLAGLDVIERIALMKLRVPVVVVTGFDTFQDPDRFDNAIMSMSDVDDIIKSHVGALHLGCVRYGRDSWKGDLQAALIRWVQS